MRVSSHGLRVMPLESLAVHGKIICSGTLVIPIGIAPAARSAATAAASCGCGCGGVFVPHVVVWPWTGKSSLTAIGTPASGPVRGEASAAASASSASVTRNAFSRGSNASIRRSAASTSSRGCSSPSRTSAASAPGPRRKSQLAAVRSSSSPPQRAPEFGDRARVLGADVAVPPGTARARARSPSASAPWRTPRSRDRGSTRPSGPRPDGSRMGAQRVGVAGDHPHRIPREPALPHLGDQPPAAEVERQQRLGRADRGRASTRWRRRRSRVAVRTRPVERVDLGQLGEQPLVGARRTITQPPRHLGEAPGSSSRTGRRRRCGERVEHFGPEHRADHRTVAARRVPGDPRRSRVRRRDTRSSTNGTISSHI